MKTTLAMFTLISFFAAVAPLVYANHDAEIENAVNAFVAALKAGDMEALEAITDGKMKERFNKMRNSDPDYKSFLIKRYAHMAIKGMTFHYSTENAATALVNVSFDGTTHDLFKWTMSRYGDGKWRIVDQPR
jgi:hypothetical protein